MPEPIEYLIVKNLQAALALISVGTGYFFTIAGSAVKLDPNTNVEALVAPTGPRPFIVLEVNPETWEYFQAGELRLVMPITVNWISESTPTDDDSRLQTYFRGCADVEKAIVVDLTRGGRAYDTKVVKRVLDFTIDGAQVWARIDLAVSLRRTYGQPNA